MDSRRSRSLVAIACAALLAVSRPTDGHAQLVVVVHKSTMASNTTSEELRRVFYGSSTVFLDRSRVSLVECGPLKSRFYRSLLNLTENEVKRRWMQLVFSGDFAMPPSEFPDDAEVKRFVASHPGAIGFISASAIDETVKVLRVDGLLPKSPGYVLP